ncbi:MAG: YbaK/aminoacyl-tRNA synthetase associated region [candidate division TM6 bacterium GW2011_GWE2_41_16]|nr:MAG: YbaK/aminoacyl-tRNA synthetase associated region [candidate division TM6 bacterium GW2011_GWE2_41_16]
MLTENALRIQDFLKEKGINTTVVEFPASTRTAQDAAQAIGCQVAQIVKSLVFCTKQTNKPILILVSGANRVDEKVLTNLVAEGVVKASADFAKETTGFAIGGVPPCGHKEKIETYIDQDLLQYKEVWAAAGTPHAVFNLSSAALLNLTNGTVIKVC